MTKFSGTLLINSLIDRAASEIRSNLQSNLQTELDRQQEDLYPWLSHIGINSTVVAHPDYYSPVTPQSNRRIVIERVTRTLERELLGIDMSNASNVTVETKVIIKNRANTTPINVNVRSSIETESWA